MNGLEVLVVGFGLGVRHALDADHVVVVSTLLSGEKGPWRAARVAALWGVGHTLSFLGLGLLVVLVGVGIPDAFERLVELAVAGLLIGFGLWHLLRALRSAEPASASGAVVTARPVAVGMVHGLAGSAGVALLAASSVPTTAFAALYLCLVALGTALGMVGLTLAIWHPIAWTVRGRIGAERSIAVASGALGVALGLWLLVAAVLSLQSSCGQA